MKTRIALLLAACTASLGAWAVDFGLDFSNVSILGSDGALGFHQSDEASLWFSAQAGSLDFYVSGHYRFEGDFSYPAGEPAETALRPWYFNVGESYVKSMVPEPFGPGTRLSWRLGRVRAEDFSGRTLSGLSDGALLALDRGTLSFVAAAGYTGLLSKADERVFITQADVDDYLVEGSFFAAKRLFGGIGVKAVELLPKHDIGFDFLAQFDLRGSDALHTQYSEFYMDGRPARGFRWKAWGTLETGWNPAFFAAMASGLVVRYAVPEFMDLRLAQSVEWASGRAGPFQAFAPIKRTTPTLIASIPFIDMAFAKFEATARLLPSVVFGPTVVAVMRASRDQPADVAFPADAASLYMGTELSATASWKATSDVSVDLSGGAFFPNTADGYPEGTPARWAVSANARVNM